MVARDQQQLLDPGSAGAHRRGPAPSRARSSTRPGRGSAGAVLARPRECPYSGRLDGRRRRRSRSDDDTWATAQLPAYGPLRHPPSCSTDFDKGVVEKISEDSRYRMAGLRAASRRCLHTRPVLGGRRPRGSSRTTRRHSSSTRWHGIRTLPVAALTTDLSGVKAWDIFGQERDMTNPIRLLFDYGEFDDDGSALRTGVRGCRRRAPRRPRRRRRPSTARTA